MSRQVNQLQDMVIRRLDELGDGTEPLSFRAAAERSRGLLTHETVRSLALGKHTNRIRDKTAQGLSNLLGVPVDRVYAAAQVPKPGVRWQWPPRFDRLNEAERRSVEDMAQRILDAYERGLRER